MADKSHLDLIIRFLKHGNVDSSIEEINKLKKAQEDAAKKGSSAMGYLSAAWKAWTGLAVTSASKIRLAFLTVLGPISAIITIVQTVVSVFRKTITVVSALRKEHDGLASAVKSASENAAGFASVLAKYGDVSGLSDIDAAASVIDRTASSARSQLEALQKQLQESKTWWKVWNRDQISDLGTQVARLGELQQRFAELTRQASEEARVRAENRRLLDAELAIRDEVLRMAEGETALRRVQLDRQLADLERMGADHLLIEEYKALRIVEINTEAAEKSKAAWNKANKDIIETSNHARAIIASNFASAVADVVTQSKTFQAAWTGAIDAVARAFIELATQKMALEAMGSMGLGAGGMFGVGMGLSMVGRGFKLAKGGIVTRPTAAIIGEAGPEAVVPLGKGGPQGQSRRSLLLGLSEEIRGASPEAVRFALDASRLASKHSRLA